MAWAILRPRANASHAADVGVHQIERLVRLATALGVEVQAAGGEAAHLEDGEHDLGRQVDVCGKLVGIPADEFIAAVGVDATEHASIGSHGELVLHGVSREGGMVGLDVQLEVIHEIVFAQKVETGRGVTVVLVGGRFTAAWARYRRGPSKPIFLA